MKKITPLFVLSVASLFGGSFAASAQIVSNGDFSANASSFTVDTGYTSTSKPTYPDYSTTPATTLTNTNPATPTDWSVAGEVGINNIAPGGYPSSGDPTDFVFLQDVGSAVSQTLTGLVAGQSYQLSFASAPRFGEGQYEGDLLIAGDVTISNTTLATVGAPANVVQDTDFMTTTIDFVATATGNSVITLANTSGSTGDDTVDFSNVVITPLTTPEPSTCVLLGLGSLALILTGKRLSSKI